jgi:hypothetical protein
VTGDDATAEALIVGPGTDVSAIASITLTLNMLETPPLRSHALYLFIERVDLVVKQCVLRLLCIARSQFIERLLNGEFIDFSHDCRRRRGRQSDSA